MENQLITTEYRFGINAQSICITEIKEWTGVDLSKHRAKQDENLKNNRTQGVLSPKNIKRLKNAINWLVISSQKKKYYSLKEKKEIEFKINFITLTIPPQEKGQITEKQFKILLNTWLTYHRKYNKLNNYVWKIETHKDGRFHLHITTDTFIYLKSINETWNTILRRNGMLEYHYKKHNNYTPPSTEVKPVHTIKKLGAYMAKYMTKSNKKNPMFSGRVWGCSMKISKVLNSRTYVSPDVMHKVTRPLFDNVIKSIEVFTEPNVFGNKWKVADIFLMDVREWIKLKGSFLYDVFQELVLFLRVATGRDAQLVLEFQYG